MEVSSLVFNLIGYLSPQYMVLNSKARRLVQEKILICVENNYKEAGHNTSYAAYVLTQNSLYYEYNEHALAIGVSEEIALKDISLVESREFQSRFPQLVFFRWNGRVFTSCEFSSKEVFDEFANLLKDVGVHVNSTK